MKKTLIAFTVVMLGVNTAFGAMVETKHSEAAAKHATQAEAKRLEAEKQPQDSKAFHRAKAEECRQREKEQYELAKHHDKLARQAAK